MAGKYALIIGNSRYDDSSLSRLRAPDVDVQALERVLKAPDIGRFDDVTCVMNEGGAAVRKEIARFYDQRQRDDLLLLYFSGHGVKDEQGHLYLALRDTESQLLAGTALESSFITGRMDRSFSKRQVLVLDCCHSGAFAHGAKAAQGLSVGTAEAFEGVGIGRVILTATDATQYAWEGDQIIGDAQNSLFTHFLIDGLNTGAADRDNDGVVTVDELFDYVREQVVVTTPKQTPYKWSYRQQGEIVLAHNPFVKNVRLPPEIEEAKNSKLSSLRLEAVRDLETLLHGHNVGRARAALAALKELSIDDSRKVATAAIEALSAHEAKKPEKTPSDNVAAAGGASDDAENVRALEPEIQPADRSDEGLSSDIFISYAREDRDKASAIADILIARGWTVWWDRRIAPGQAFDVAIERELSTCRCAIVLWSGNSVNSKWVRNEARRASRREVLVPIRIEDVEMPLEFENLQTANLSSWGTAANLPELVAFFERIEALAPIPDDRLARDAVQGARREFAAGRVQAAIAKLEQFRPVHEVVTRALTEMRAEAGRTDRERAEGVRRKAEAAEQQRAIAAGQAREREEAARRDAEAAEQQRAIAAEQAREREEAARRDAEAAEQQRAIAAEQAREREEAARRDAEAAEQQRAIAAEQAREREEAARREAAAAERQRKVAAERARIEELRLRDDPSTAHMRPVTVEPVFVPAVESHPPAVARSSSRSIQIAVAAVVVLAVFAAAWGAGIWRRRSPDVGRSSTQRQTESNLATPVQRPTPAESSPSTPPRNPAVQPAVDSAPTTAIAAPAPAPAPAPEAPTNQAAVAKRLDDLRNRARTLRQSGDRMQALNSVAEGLQIDSQDPVLRSMLDAWLRDAAANAAQAKQKAEDAGADNTNEVFARGIQKEREGIRQQRERKLDAATRSFWLAAEQFSTAARLAEEEAEQARLAEERSKNQGGRSQATPAPSPSQPSERKALNQDAEQDLANQMLRRYEVLCATLKAENVRSVYPSAPIDQLAKEFAEYRSYTMNIKPDRFRFTPTSDRVLGSVPSRVTYDIVLKSGASKRTEQAQTFLIEKHGATWIIVGIE